MSRQYAADKAGWRWQYRFRGLRCWPGVAKGLGLMRNLATCLLMVVVLVFASCARDDLSRSDHEFIQRHQQFQRDYCSTNILTASDGLMAFRAWVSNFENPCEVLNRDSVIFEVDARLFLIQEHLGDTNAAEQFYRESIEARDRYLAYIRSLNLPQQARAPTRISSKDQLRELVDHQDKHFDVGWKKITETQK